MSSHQTNFQMQKLCNGKVRIDQLPALRCGSSLPA
uniref:Uncharacterized protein n=1 Tax=Anguilla anguilla TaxID=7936 RepID=A0A0E9W2A9_ANGAN